jgi:predicted RecA/RadA family phage recombinase
MALATYVQAGETLDYTNGTQAAIDYNQIVVLGSRLAVAQADIAVGAVGAVAVCGVFTMPAVNNDDFAVGDRLYWNAGTSKLQATPTPVFAGLCVAAKLTAGTTARVLLAESACPQMANVQFTPYDPEAPTDVEQAMLDVLTAAKACGAMAADPA